MQVFKFGGASLRNAENIRNVASIIQSQVEPISFIVISALGKTTNAFELLISLFSKKDANYLNQLDTIIEDHLALCSELFDTAEKQAVESKLISYKQQIHYLLSSHADAHYTFIYDQIVPYGEIFSSYILSTYLQKIGTDNQWVDARTIISTDSNYTEAKVDFAKTQPQVKALLQQKTLIITQGFIGSNEEKYSTTLGREGSDYTAAVIAYCSDAQQMTIWKDVPAVLNADPRLFSDTVAIPQLSYREAIEMTYYGAQVIHPKTIKPLQNKNIPLVVRSFIDKEAVGTIIGGANQAEFIQYPPIIVYKKDQVLISISVKDFSFVAEENLSTIFAFFSKNGLRMNMTHSGAISFSACVENKAEKIQSLIRDLSDDYTVKYSEDLELLTIRHYSNEKIEQLTKDKVILLTHKTRNTIQILMREEGI